MGSKNYKGHTMKAKTINRIIKQKVTIWLESIEDDKVRRAAKRDTIVTGGCIASLFLKERVNDYDIYFRTRETTIKVAEYYIKLYKKVCDDKLKNKAKSIDITIDTSKHDQVYIRMHSGYDYSIDQDDYKYFDSADPDNTDASLDELPKAKEDEGPKYRPVFMTSNAITLSDKIQVITRFYGTPDQIHGNYDFVHCMNYWSFKEGLVLKKEALAAILSKELRYVGSLYPFCSMVRTRKFIRRDWTINAGQYLKMAFQVSKLNLEDPKVLYDQLIGVDIAYFMEVISLLKAKMAEDGQDTIDDTYLVAIIDKIF